MMKPDFVLYTSPSSITNYELFFVEVKRKGNFANGTGESDLVKLGKEMQIALNKLVLKKIKNPEVVGMVVEGKINDLIEIHSCTHITILQIDHTAIVFKMDLVFNGQYRMAELFKFRFFSGKTDEILLLPDVLEKLSLVRVIIHIAIVSHS
jgi:hypothetical protein